MQNESDESKKLDCQPRLPINQIICGDCIEVMKQFPDNCIDAIITDPPYGLNYLSNHYKNGNPFTPILNDNELFVPLEELWRVLKPTGCMFIFYSQKKPLIDVRIRNVIVWVKNNWTAGNLVGDFGNQYELIAYIPKENFKIHSKRYSNVLHFDRISPDKMLHPTQKPITIISRLIEIATDKNNLVLDCFLGSGTTAVACKLLNRNYIGVEINTEYCKIAQARIDNIPKNLNCFSELSQ